MTVVEVTMHAAEQARARHPVVFGGVCEATVFALVDQDVTAALDAGRVAATLPGYRCHARDGVRLAWTGGGERVYVVRLPSRRRRTVRVLTVLPAAEQAAA